MTGNKASMTRVPAAGIKSGAGTIIAARLNKKYNRLINSRSTNRKIRMLLLFFRRKYKSHAAVKQVAKPM